MENENIPVENDEGKPMNPVPPEVGANPTENIAELPSVPREAMVSSAVRFLQNPKVSSSPLQQKRDFLISKGLTNQEVDLACQRVGVSTVTSHEHMTSPPQNHVIATIPTYPVQTFQGPRWLQNFRDFLHFVVLLGGAAYGCYYLWRRYVIKWLFGPGEKSLEELNLEASLNVQKSIVELLRSVETLQVSLNAQCSSLQKLLGKNGQGTGRDLEKQCLDIKDEIKSVKAIMLGTSRFPTNPTIKPMSIPSWQLEDKSNSGQNDNSNNGQTESLVENGKTATFEDEAIEKISKSQKQVGTSSTNSSPDLVLKE